ncbi:conserved hypothetical protein [Neospora caninum Liverpool]|uniref:RecQ-mediated genome instability protein 1 n=1 Tax=Neospora caninum (strain Liverpool) TaxID=572307 RepID=F0VCS6_NEOCL|nr:conserved hypothetical protein [Neospora caninum Liverpool]CBZ51441.1 conserved hypothetical protein [Neospora caninum Liverpool]CEL65389.1 TPA: hypothetical protein BN1204_012390 [Neospora caninum Liverpool]|eukprot:XP_003881474.1 conserved hypothetical protein [Neospora caninum Liverpool]
MAVAASVLSQLHQQWNVSFKSEALDLLPILIADACDGLPSAGVAPSSVASPSGNAAPVSLHALQRFLLSSDLRSLRLAPPLPEGFMAQKTASSLPAPLMLMLLSSRDITLPSKEGEEDFLSAAAAPCYRGHKRRLLLLKLTDGAGCTYTAIEHHYCRQLDVPLVPGLKLLLRPTTRITNGLFLLEPATVQVLGGSVASLESAYKLREHVQQARMHKKSERASLNGAVGGSGDGEEDGPPRFLPFSYAAAKKALAEGKEVVAAALVSQQKSSEKAQTARRGDDREGARKTLQQLKEESSAGGEAAGSKVERFQQRDEPKNAALQALVVNPHERGRERRGAREDPDGETPPRGGRGGRGGTGGGRRRRRDDGFEEEGLYMKDSKAPVSYNLLDLICKEKPSSASATGNEQTAGATPFSLHPRDEGPTASTSVSTLQRPGSSEPASRPARDRGRAGGSGQSRGGRGHGVVSGDSSPRGGKNPEEGRGGNFFSYYYAEDPSTMALFPSAHAPAYAQRSSARGGVSSTRPGGSYAGGGHHNASGPQSYSSHSPSTAYPAPSLSAHPSPHAHATRRAAEAARTLDSGPGHVRGARGRGRGGERGRGMGRGRGGGGRGKREF